MNTSEAAVSIKDTAANPAPPGVPGFGMMTVLYSTCTMPGFMNIIP